VGELRLVEDELKTNLGKDLVIFVGSACDMWADSIIPDWIHRTLENCRRYPDNRYLFQSKNPKRILAYKEFLPTDPIIGTTIETNRHYDQMGNAPPVRERAGVLYALGHYCETMVTIEPIMDFDPMVLIDLIEKAEPEWVNIGADSKGHNLPEPSAEKIYELVDAISTFTKIRKKTNLERLLKN
jgi:hypothetical protein